MADHLLPIPFGPSPFSVHPKAVMSSDLSPFFPPALEREILETTAYCYPETIAKLLLVSRRALLAKPLSARIGRMKYITVVADSQVPVGCQCPGPVLLQAIQSNSKPASFFHRHVVHAFIASKQPEQILSACSGIQNLVLIVMTHPDPAESITPSLAAMKPRQLTLPWTTLLTVIDPRHSIFTILTQFHLYRSVQLGQAAQLPSFLAQLHVLTHFTMATLPIGRTGTTIWPALAMEILTGCQALKVLITTDSGLETRPSIDDIRFVYMRLRYPCFQDGWLAETQGGIDHWACADAFIAKRQRGEIQPASHCFIEPADGILGFDTVF
ncbi:hypothetical protein DFH08DRAFT_1081917 [Mycena albidolilacea]|uniref:Uncharacterized protein n=1 Tax=Mycena albidolilacea TaxID=1033008 RepID=A0AAD6ZWJ0_9AGAR|nr:hypothetical protein DFH08DRAFT_1081917 [Mycena albidolilacea]